MGSHGRIGIAIRSKGPDMCRISEIDGTMPKAEHAITGRSGKENRPACIRHLRPALLSLIVGCLSVALASTPALAGQARLMTGVFGMASTNPSDPYPLASADAVAVDSETHDVYVTDEQNHRVEKFDSTGHFILMFGKEVDHTTGGDVCTALSGDVCQAGVAGASPGEFEFPRSIAVDNSGIFGRQGDVYVGDLLAGVVSKFDAEGNLISSWGNNGEGRA